MAVRADRVSVGTTATAIVTANNGGLCTITHRGGAVSIFVGGSNVSTSGDGYDLAAAGEQVTLSLKAGDVVYGIVAAATENVDFILNE